MKVRLTRGYKGMPEGAIVGHEIDIDDADFAEQRRLGNVERVQGGQQNQTSQERGWQQQNSPTAVQPIGTEEFSDR